MTSLSLAVTDGLTITRRNLIKVKRVPDLIVFATLSPIMFVLLFRYVFGGAITVPGDISYAEFLLPGIFAQTVIFGSTHHRGQPRRRPAEGPDRPVPVAADGAFGGAGRADGRRPVPQRAVHRGHGGHRPDRRLADPHVVRSRPRAGSCCCSGSPTRCRG